MLLTHSSRGENTRQQLTSAKNGTGNEKDVWIERKRAQVFNVATGCIDRNIIRKAERLAKRRK